MNNLIDYSNALDYRGNETLFQSEKDAVSFIETAMILMETFLRSNARYLFDEEEGAEDLDEIEEIVFEQVKMLMEEQLADTLFMDLEAEEDFEVMFDEAFDLFMNTFVRDQDYEEVGLFFSKELPRDPRKEKIQAAIDKIRSKPQPTQRTPAWYEFRHNLITASNAWKALDSQAQQNSLIFEKCQPMKTFETDPQNSFVNVNSSLHWGQKYEPLSVLIYEKRNETEVEDFGCIQHDEYKFLGASPDGIITDESSPKFGRMLEIKNVVSREITGIPKKEYWVQMQLQMEVCDLDDCDFLETKFVEYENMQAFLQDKTDKQRGLIMYFQTPEGKPYYIYKLLDEIDKTKIEAWEEEMIETHQIYDAKTDSCSKTWVCNYYWKLEVYSCVYIERDRLWFRNNIEQMAQIWATIEKERISGFEHRAPKRRATKDTSATPFVKQPGVEETVATAATTSSAVKKPTFLLNIIKLQASNV